MTPEQAAARYMPTSPLSPKMQSNSRPLSPQPSRPRSSQHRQSSRPMHMTLPRYHPTKFQPTGSETSSSLSLQGSPMAVQRLTQSIPPESPRLMRDKQKEFLDRALLSSKIAASPMGSKPGAPRLDPLGSPQGQVTPFALEEARDYFQVAGSGKRSPASSPGGQSSNNETLAGKEDLGGQNLRNSEFYA